MKKFYSKDQFTLEQIENEINESKERKLNLDMKEKDEKGNTRFMTAVLYDSSKIANLIMEYAECNDIVLKLNDKIKSSNSCYPIEQAINNGNTELVNLIINYANKNNIVLEFNDVGSLVNGIFDGCKNINMVVDVLDYLSNINNKNKTIISKSLNGIFLAAIKNDDLDTIKLIVNYAYIKNVELNFKYGFDMIEEALKRTVNKPNPTLSYVNGILVNWHKKGYKAVKDLEKENNVTREEESTRKYKKVQDVKTKYQDVNQREYTNLESFYDNM